MLQFKIVPLIYAKGFTKPYTFLRKFVGFASGKAVKFSQQKQQYITLADLSKLCVALNCTPNDLLYWQQTPSLTLHPAHPCVTSMKQPEQLTSFTHAIQRMSDEDAAEIYKLMEEKLKAKKD